VAQSERHAELMRLAAQTKKRCDVLETRRMSDWKALDEARSILFFFFFFFFLFFYFILLKGMDEAVSLLQEVCSCVAECSATLLSIQLRLPDLELALTSLERVQLQEQERVWRENTANCIEKETEQIKAKLDQRYRDALQAAFDEQMKRFKESGVAPVPLPKPQKTIEEVSILPDENEKEEMEKFLGEDEDPGRPGGDEDE
jgi:hypothetical protein